MRGGAWCQCQRRPTSRVRRCQEVRSRWSQLKCRSRAPTGRSGTPLRNLGAFGGGGLSWRAGGGWLLHCGFSSGGSSRRRVCRCWTPRSLGCPVGLLAGLVSSRLRARSGRSTRGCFPWNRLLSHNLRDLCRGGAKQSLMSSEIHWLELKPIPGGLVQRTVQWFQDGLASS